jgi:hypothetical protein
LRLHARGQWVVSAGHRQRAAICPSSRSPAAAAVAVGRRDPTRNWRRQRCCPQCQPSRRCVGRDHHWDACTAGPRHPTVLVRPTPQISVHCSPPCDHGHRLPMRGTMSPRGRSLDEQQAISTPAGRRTDQAAPTQACALWQSIRGTHGLVPAIVAVFVPRSSFARAKMQTPVMVLSECRVARPAGQPTAESRDGPPSGSGAVDRLEGARPSVT